MDALKKMLTGQQQQQPNLLHNLLRQLDVSGHWYAALEKWIAFKPALVNLRRMVPPFGSHATLAGSQHFMTFDRKFYDFAGECSYLLFSDFSARGGNFSVVVNYEAAAGRVTRKWLTVVSDGRQIDLDTDGGDGTDGLRVTVNGRKIDMPLVYNGTSVTRRGQVVAVDHANGYRVECNLLSDVCNVHVTGWSFGQTAGLLGTYNHEPSDDLMTPYRQLRNDRQVDSFAHSWKVGASSQRCRTRNLAVNATATATATGTGTGEPSERNRRLCDDVFDNGQSFLRPCFGVVDAAPYRRMCLTDLAAHENSAKKELAVCTSAAAYVNECHLAGLDLFVPPQCVRCQLENGMVIGSGEMKTFKNDAPRSADVVLVVDQKACLKNSRLSALAGAVDAALKDKSLAGNRFAIVAYGGRGLRHQPHTQTAEGGRIWATAKGVQSALEDMPFDGDAHAQGDTLAALRYAVNLPFRAAVSKQIVLASCAADCPADGYADALTLLIENDVRLHLLQPRDFSLKGKQNSSEQVKVIPIAIAIPIPIAISIAILDFIGRWQNVFGLDAQQVYTARDVTNLKGDRELARQLSVPKDFCTPLALETNGTLFDVKKMSADNGIQAKKFVDIFARRLAATAQPSDCQRCDCIGDRDGVGSILCQRCVSPILEVFIKVTLDSK